MTYLNDPDVFKAGLVIIGNEILSGRTQDTNTNWLADQTIKNGISLVEVRVVTDRKDKIIQAVNDLRKDVDYVFTTGGIGPTHDDITAESVAEALGVDLELNAQAYQMLVDYYGSEDEVTESRKKMAMIPKGAKLIHNRESGAPGFVLENVYVMAGVPRIMHAMFAYALEHYLEQGKIVKSNTLMCAVAESEMALHLKELQEHFSEVEIGSYPHFREGVPSLNLVLRSTEEEPLKEATKALLGLIEEHGIATDAMSFQVFPD